MLRYVRNLVPRMGLGSDEVWASIVHVSKWPEWGTPSIHSGTKASGVWDFR